VTKMGGIIVVADTHFGIKKGSISMPGYFGDFLRWIKELEEEKKKTVKILDGETPKDKTLIKPDKIIFLGDILELWDSEDEAVNTCVSTLMPTLAEIGAEKIYVLGNHDNILDKALLSQEKEYYPLGESNLKIVEEYPSDGFLPIGDQNYLFVHGHQFDKHFTNIGKLYNILPALRNVSNALTNYVPLLFGISIISAIINKLISNDKILVLGKPEIVVLLFFLTFPKLYMTFGRRFWSWFSGVKYKKHETIEKFVEWWKKFIGEKSFIVRLKDWLKNSIEDIFKNKERKKLTQKLKKSWQRFVNEVIKKKYSKKEIPNNVNVIYGHTHFLNYVNLQEEELQKRFEKRPELYEFYLTKLRKKEIEEKKPTLVNISAWIKDIKNIENKKNEDKENKKNDEKKKEYKNVMVASFLYIDDEGFEFFGWDWYEKSVFHIPKEVIIIRRELEKNVVPDWMAKKLAEIGWPENLIKKWKKHTEL